MTADSIAITVLCSDSAHTVGLDRSNIERSGTLRSASECILEASLRLTRIKHSDLCSWAECKTVSQIAKVPLEDLLQLCKVCTCR
jgi:hypothetical protein